MTGGGFDAVGKRRNCEAIGGTGGRESVAAGRTGLGFARISVSVINLLTPQQDNESLKHYSNLMISFALFFERSRAGLLVNYYRKQIFRYQKLRNYCTLTKIRGF